MRPLAAILGDIRAARDRVAVALKLATQAAAARNDALDSVRAADVALRDLEDELLAAAGRPHIDSDLKTEERLVRARLGL